MKPRKSGESDAAYIARLESANASLKAHNGSLATANNLFTTKGRQAASFAGTVLNAAAEATGTVDDPRVRDALACFDALAGSPWSKDIPVPDAFPDLGGADLVARGADCEMILQSAFEAADCALHPVEVYSLLKTLPEGKREVVWGVIGTLHRRAVDNLSAQARAATGVRKPAPFSPPKIETLEQARTVIYDLWMEISTTLSDIEMSRAMLRLDLRAGMYVEALGHIAQAIHATEEAARDLPMDRRETVPW